MNRILAGLVLTGMFALATSAVSAKDASDQIGTPAASAPRLAQRVMLDSSNGTPDGFEQFTPGLHVEHDRG